MANDRILDPRAVGSIVALGALGFDQTAKWAAAYPLALRSRGVIEVLPFFDLRWAENFGVSMSLFSANGPLGRWLLVAITTTIAAVVAAWLWRNHKQSSAIALGLILGGALGNIIDRLRLGYVVDFLDLHVGEWRPFQIFNTADCMISVGVAMLLLQSILTRESTGAVKLHRTR